MGYPIEHSLSPVMHEAAFQALGLEAIYAPFEVPPACLRGVLRGLVAAGIDGVNVTVPLKERIVPLLHGLSREAAMVRAVNTVVIRRGRLVGHNTDVSGLSRAVAELGWRPAKRSSVVILGAGGAAKAAAWAVCRHPGVELTIANRHPAKAQRLARWLARARPHGHVRVQALRDVELGGAHLLINATSVGMRAEDDVPIAVGRLRRPTMVYDVVYTRQTPLVREARRRGCVAANGLSMLVYQGAEAFRLWWHRRPPIDAMRRAVAHALAAR